jgi:hypothetical protein
MRSVFAQETTAEIESSWDDLAAPLAELFPKDPGWMHEAKEDGCMASIEIFPRIQHSINSL